MMLPKIAGFGGWTERAASSTPTRSIAPTKELEAFIQAQVMSGHYSSASELVRSGLRLLIEHDGAGKREPRTRSGRNSVQ